MTKLNESDKRAALSELATAGAKLEKVARDVRHFAYTACLHPEADWKWVAGAHGSLADQAKQLLQVIVSNAALLASAAPIEEASADTERAPAPSRPKQDDAGALISAACGVIFDLQVAAGSAFEKPGVDEAADAWCEKAKAWLILWGDE